MRKIVKGTLVALAAALLVGPSVPAGVAAMPTVSKADILAFEQRRDTDGASRSSYRGDCEDCPPKVWAPRSPSVPPTPPAPPRPKSCTQIANSIWKGACLPRPSKVELVRIAREVLSERGWNTDEQWSCLEQLVQKESGWNPYSENSIHAYGLPQAYPGNKMASIAADWGYNPRTHYAG